MLWRRVHGRAFPGGGLFFRVSPADGTPHDHATDDSVVSMGVKGTGALVRIGGLSPLGGDGLSDGERLLSHFDGRHFPGQLRPFEFGI